MSVEIEQAPGHPEIERVIAPNPGPMTLEGTNTYLLDGGDGVYVIDPGPAHDAHLAAVTEAAARRGGVAGVLLTHSHADHSAGVEAIGAPLLWGQVSASQEAEALAAAAAGGVPDLNATPMEPPSRIGPFAVLPTPGHAPDHVCFVWGRAGFCGDLVLGHGSTIVPPAAGGGSLADYMASLQRLDDAGCDLLAPGHGPWITDPAARIREYAAHRRERERRLVHALERGERSRNALLAEVWDDVPEVLRPAAALAMEAHLEKLEHDGVLRTAELTG
jgi:glyoxylase-like metal-dependent hydrolase (beta-lactamase superfamily II)